MPPADARLLTGRHRTVTANRQPGFALAFVAGAINAGGFLAVRQYTSHVTGMLSSLADNLVLGRTSLIVDAIVGVLAFLVGAMCTAMLVDFARRRGMHSEYALPLVLQAALTLCFGLMGARLATFEGLLVPFTVVLPCFIVGLQNAVVSKLSAGVVRTTHMTGIVTDRPPAPPRDRRTAPRGGAIARAARPGWHTPNHVRAARPASRRPLL